MTTSPGPPTLKALQRIAGGFTPGTNLDLLYPRVSPKAKPKWNSQATGALHVRRATHL